MSNNSVLVGVGVPADATGVNGDYYFDNVSEKYYIKANGIWQDRGSLKHVWQADGKNIYFNQGSVGVGTAQPQEALHIDRGSLHISNTTNYTLESLGYYQSTSPADASLAGFQIFDERAYLAYGTAGLVIVDVSNPTQPAALTSYKVSQDCRVNGVHVSGSTAFVACASHGIHVVNVSDPYNAALEYTYAVGSAGATGGVYSVGLNIFLASGNNLVVLEVDSDKSLKNTVTYPGGTTQDPSTAATLVGFAIKDALVLSGSGSYVQEVTCYLNYGNDGLQIVDFTDLSAPTVAYHYTPGQGRLQSLRLAQEMAFLALGSSSTTTSGGIEVLDITDPHEPQLLTQYSTDISVVDLAVREDGNLVYLIGSSNSIELVELRRAEQSGTMAARRVKQLTVEHLQSTSRIVIALRSASPDDSSRVYVAGKEGGLEIVDVAEEGTSASFDGSVTIGGVLYLDSLKEGALSVDKSGAVRSSPKALSAKLYEDRISPWLRMAGETSIYLATNYGQSVLKWDKYGFPTALVRIAINALVFTEGFESVDLLNWWRDAFQDVDSIITNTGIAVNSYNIDLLRTALGWVEVPGATWPRPTPNTGWARQLGRFVDVQDDNAIVIGTGSDAVNKLVNRDPGTIMLGAGSVRASLVIRPGTQNDAGAVAIGHASYVDRGAAHSLAIGVYMRAEHADAVVIGSGLDADHQLTSAAPGTVTIGAGSPLPSLVIQPGTQNDAGAVAIGHASESAGSRSLAIGSFISAAAPNAVVIGSGLDADHQLTSAAPGTVTIGAGSPLPSLVIQPGTQNDAGAVAIGHASESAGSRSLAIGSFISAAAPNAVVIGSGLDADHQLTSAAPGIVTIGAGSPLPSLVIQPGTQNDAGAVAIGHASESAGSRSLAIGSFISAAAPNAVVIGSGLDADHQLTSAAPGTVTIGAGSPLPSLVIQPGTQNDAGAVAIGHASESAGSRSLAIGSFISAAAPNAVVIGSGLDADHQLTSAAPGIVTIGAGSPLPSLVIQPGTQNDAGAVAIGHASQSAGSRSLAIGSFISAAAPNAVVIGSGISTANPLVNSVADTIVLGARSTKASLIIQPGTQNDAGTVALGANLIPLDDNTWSLGDNTHYWGSLFVGAHSIHIGENGNESVISYDAQARQLDLGAIKVDTITLTGLSGCTAETNFVAVDSAGKLICAPEPGAENADRAQRAADEAAGSATEAAESATAAAGSATEATGSATAAAASTVAAVGSAAAALGSAGAAAGSATEATASALGAAGSAIAAAASAALAAGSSSGAGDDADRAQHAADEAAASAAAAAQSADAAAGSGGAADTSATAAAAAAALAAVSAAAAAQSADAAAGSAGAADTSATAAAAAATMAVASAAAAAQSAGAAAGSAGAADASATAATAAAATAAVSAAAASQSADAAAGSAGAADISATAAAAAATTAVASAAAASQSAGAAAGSAGAADISATAATTAATTAAASAAAAAQSADAAAGSAGAADTSATAAMAAAATAAVSAAAASQSAGAAADSAGAANTLATAAATSAATTIASADSASQSAVAAAGSAGAADTSAIAAAASAAAAEAAAASVSHTVTTTVSNWASLFSNRPLWMGDNGITDANSAVAVSSDGSNTNVFLFSTAIQANDGGAGTSQVVSRFYHHNGYQWYGLPSLLQDTLPAFDPGQLDVQEILEHHLVVPPGGSSSSPLLTVGALASYATPVPSPEQREEGLNALFLATYDGRAWTFTEVRGVDGGR